MSEHSDEFATAIEGRVCGADFVPVDDSHPVEWLRGKVSVEFVFDRTDLPAVVIGSTWRLIPTPVLDRFPSPGADQ